MATRDDAVAVVVDPNFGDQVIALAERIPVWVVASETNRLIVEALWARYKANPLDCSVTIFNWNAEYSSEDILLTELGTIDRHHPSWSVMEVYGVARTLLLMETLQEFGVTDYEDLADGFVASRPDPTLA